MLQKQNLTIPLSLGLDTKTDEKLVEPGKATILENARFERTGTINKVLGNVALGAETAATAVVTDINASHVFTPSGIKSYFNNAWQISSRFVGAPLINREFISSGVFDHLDPDMDSNGALNVYVCRRAIGGSQGHIRVTLEDADTLVKRSASFSGTNGRALPRVLITGTGASTRIHLFSFSLGTPVGDLQYRVLNSSLVELSTANISAMTPLSSFDIIKDSTHIYMARVVGNSILLRKYNLLGVQELTATFTGATIHNDSSISNSISLGIDNDYVHCTYLDSASTAPYVTGFTKDLVTQIPGYTYFDAAQTFKTAMSVNNGQMIVAYSGNNGINPATTSSSITFLALTYTVSGYTLGIVSFLNMVSLMSNIFGHNGKLYVIVGVKDLSNNAFLLYNITDNYYTNIFSAQINPSRLSVNALEVNASKVYSYGGGIFKTSLPLIMRVATTDPNNIVGDIGQASIEIDLSGYSYGKSFLGDGPLATSGLTLNMDRENPSELGFMFSPIFQTVTANTGVSNPDVSSKTFTYCAIYEAYDSFGQLTRSAPSSQVSITTPSNTVSISIVMKPLPVSLKKSFSIMYFRTTNGGSVFYRTDSFTTDITSDAALTDNELLYTEGGVLQNDPVPTAKFSVSGGDRLFLGGLEDGQIAYSKKKLIGETAEFSDFFRIKVSAGGNADRSNPTALGYMDGKLIIFKEGSIYYVTGDGPNELGQNDSFTEPEILSTDIGCEDFESVINVPKGIVFKSPKGFYLLDRGLGVNYIGQGVENNNAERIVSSIIPEKFSEARFYTDSAKCLVYNFLYEQWSIVTESVLDASLYKDGVIKVNGTVAIESMTSFQIAGAAYSMKIKTPWIKLTGIQDFGRIFTVTILGKYKSAHTLRVTAYYDYATDYSEVYNIAPLVTDSQYQYRIHLRKQKCESIQFEIQDLNQIGESMELSVLTLEVGVKKGSMKLPATRKY